MDKASNSYRPILIYVAVGLVTLSAYWQVRHNEFIATFDDDLYIVDNSHVNAGITFEGLRWAFTTSHAFNWHPLTWLSHMVDCQLFGVDASSHHLMNVAFHILNSLLLLTVLWRMTGRLWASAFVSAAFALHPLHVESVAWASERKDVLSTLFWMLTLLAYASYCKRPNLRRYLLVFLALGLGLLAKQMLVTLPIVLLALDYWPLRRLRLKAEQASDMQQTFPAVSRGRCVLEKAPLLALSAAASIVVYLVQQQTGPVRPFAEYPLAWQVGNALVAYVAYIGKTVWPSNLAIFYPHRGANLPIWHIAWSALLLASVTVGAMWRTKKRPYLLSGWLWYLVTLVPVIGLVQVGLQAYADRYTYIPLTGLFIIVAWGAVDVLSGVRNKRTILSLCALVPLLAFAFLTRRQVGYWRNGMTLYKHATVAVKDNWWGYHHIGELLVRENKPDEAIENLKEAIRIKPDFTNAYNEIGVIFIKQGKLEEAIENLKQALRINPNFVEGRSNLAFALSRAGKREEAAKHYSMLLKRDPGRPEAHYNLANILVEMGRLDEAGLHFRKVIEIKPDYFEARSNLANVAAKQGRLEEAITHWEELVKVNPNEVTLYSNLGTAYQRLDKPDKPISHWERALQLKPDHVIVLAKLSWLLATSRDAQYRDGGRAVELARRGCELTGYTEPTLLDKLAAGYAEAGQFDEAIRTGETALRLARIVGPEELAAIISTRLEWYKRGEAYHE